MKKPATRKEYARRLMGVLQLIWQQPQYSLAQLAEAACFSPYHFHRIYREMMGESLGMTQQRIRLLRAARELGEADGPALPRLARRSGYGSSAAFVRAFAASYGMTPVAYRRERLALLQLSSQQEAVMFTIRMHQQAEPLSLAASSHRGPYIHIGEAFARLQLHKTELPLLMPPRWFGLYLDDPQSVVASELRSAAALAVQPDAALPAGLSAMTIPAGRYAVLEHVGPYSELAQAYQWLYGVWLPQSGEQPGDVPVIEQYLNLPVNTPPAELRTEIWLALQ